jgi:hypothetical protein
VAEDVVVKEHLSENLIEAGVVLTHALDETEWPVTAALWLFFSESNQWRLIFASPTVNKEGPRNAYKHIQNALRNLPTGTSSVGL